MNFLLNNSNIKRNLIALLVISFIFLFDIKYEYFQIRYIILLLLIPSFFFIYLDFKKKNFNFLKSFLFLSLFSLIHITYILISEENKYSLYSLYSLFYLQFIFIISFYFKNFINNQIYFIIRLFLIIFSISLIYSLYNFIPDTPYFCGGIPDFLNLIDKESVENKYYRLSFKELIFLENSHLGMIAPSVIIYMLYKIIIDKTNKFDKILFIIFLIICFIKSSTTFLLGIIVSLILLLIFNFKQFNKKIIFSFSVLVIFCSSILVFNDECKSRFSYYGSDESIKEKNQNILLDKNIQLIVKDKLKIGGSLSSGVFYHAINIMQQSFFEKPLGWGLNRYEYAFDYFNEINPPVIKILNFMNNKDGSNNFIKIIVEFGVFGLILYFIVFLFLIEKSIPIELKIFYLPFIITQSIRGSGYFNGGFVLILFLIIINYISFKKN